MSYTTREAAEEAAEKLANRLSVKGVRLKLMYCHTQHAVFASCCVAETDTV